MVLTNPKELIFAYLSGWLLAAWRRVAVVSVVVESRSGKFAKSEVWELRNRLGSPNAPNAG